MTWLGLTNPWVNSSGMLGCILPCACHTPHNLPHTPTPTYLLLNHTPYSGSTKPELMNLSTLSPPIPDPKLPNPPKDYKLQPRLLRRSPAPRAESACRLHHRSHLNVPEIWSCAEWYRATPLVASGFSPHGEHGAQVAVPLHLPHPSFG